VVLKRRTCYTWIRRECRLGRGRHPRIDLDSNAFGSVELRWPEIRIRHGHVDRVGDVVAEFAQGGVEPSLRKLLLRLRFRVTGGDTSLKLAR